MRHFVLGGLLVLTSAAAIAYVYANPTATPCCLSESTPVAAAAEDSSASPCCEKCKSGVVDVVDLNSAYSVNTASSSTISFDEPPLAKPRAIEFLPAQFEETNSELAPAPRLVK